MTGGGNNEKAHPNEPYGSCLLARDTPENRKLFPHGPFGKVPVAETICPSPDVCPHYHYTEDTVDKDAAEDTPIHLLIAAFRDKLVRNKRFSFRR